MVAICSCLRDSLLQYCVRRSPVLPLNFLRRGSTHSVTVKNGIKRGVNKVERKDGHHVSPRNVFWEERMRSVPKPPLWIEHSNGTSKPPASKSSNMSLTSTDKRIAATAVITMIIAVIAFKLVFGRKDQQVEENESTGISAAA